MCVATDSMFVFFLRACIAKFKYNTNHDKFYNLYFILIPILIYFIIRSNINYTFSKLHTVKKKKKSGKMVKNVFENIGFRGETA